MTTSNNTGEGTRRLLSPQQCALILVDCQPRKALTVHSIDRHTLLNNQVGLAMAAQSFEVPTILTNVCSNTFTGPIFPEIQAVFERCKPIERTAMNFWEDERCLAAVKAAGRKKLLIAGIWTETCVALPALSALAEGFEVGCVADACGDVSGETHDLAVQRMIQAGVVPMTWTQVLLEWQRAWARQETYASFLAIAKHHAGLYAIGNSKAIVENPAARN